ncbi:MAG: serine protease [Chloroflexi bacterium]|nr:serine protease [Chloroflexota bacterium]
MDTTSNTDLLSAFSNGLADAVERVAKAVVLVDSRPRQGASGLVYKEDFVLVADHVLEREDNLSVTTGGGRTVPATLAGRDGSNGLALLKAPGLNLAPATAASGEARVGQLVLAVGRPGDSGPMASSGVVSSIGGPVRTGRGSMLERFITTDAIPYPGFSGGPLIDTQGAVLGIITTGLMRDTTLAIPAEVSWRVGDSLAQHGSIKRGYLGISSQLVEIPLSQRAGKDQERGLLIIRVENGSPAEKGGLLLGDILVSVDGQQVNDIENLHLIMSGDRVGKVVPVEVVRGATLKTHQVTVGERS